MMTNGPYKVTYTLSVQYENVDLSDHPKQSLTTFTFDGTDAHISVVIDQFAAFLKAAGYNFGHLEVV